MTGATVRTTSVAPAVVPVRVGWTASDATSGVASTDVQVSRDGGSYRTVSAGTSARSLTRDLASSKTYRFRTRSRDVAGNVSGWVYDRTLRPKSYSEAAGMVDFSASWSGRSAAGYLGGHAKQTSKAGAKARITFTGRSFAWVAATGPTRGKAAVYVNGVRVATIDLYSPTTRYRRVVFTKTWGTSVSRQIVIRSLGTSGRPSINVDGILIVR